MKAFITVSYACEGCSEVSQEVRVPFLDSVTFEKMVKATMPPGWERDPTTHLDRCQACVSRANLARRGL